MGCWARYSPAVNPVERLQRIARKPSRLVLGLMSGMSADGLDLALVRIEGSAERVTAELLSAEMTAYGPGLRGRIRAAREGGPDAVAALDFELADLWAADVLAFLARAGVPPASVDALGSHGQTLFHRPRAEGRPALTLQVGRGDVLAERTGILTVSDFRPRDIAAGGEGAPLIPMADWLLFGGGEATSACHNLGSIANVTVLPAAFEDILAFDTGPANALIDAFARRCPGDEEIDRDGALSAAGAVNDDVLLSLYTKRAAWLAQAPPKSAGYGTFGPALADQIVALHADVSPHDLVRTAVEFTATTLTEAYERFVLTRHPDLELVRFSGGGCRNPTLMTCIGERLARAGLRAEPLDETWIDAKEAVGFALLADRTVRGLPGNVPSATGAANPVVLGTVSM